MTLKLISQLNNKHSYGYDNFSIYKFTDKTFELLQSDQKKIILQKMVYAYFVFIFLFVLSKRNCGLRIKFIFNY